MSILARIMRQLGLVPPRVFDRTAEKAGGEQQGGEYYAASQ